MCEGGPFLRVDDPNNWSDYYFDDDWREVWNFGVEAWCNLKGRYTHIVGDMSVQTLPDYKQRICQLGIMGTRYMRDSILPTSV